MSGTGGSLDVISLVALGSLSNSTETCQFSVDIVYMNPEAC